MNKIYHVLCLIFLKISTCAIAVASQPSQLPEITCHFVADGCLSNQSPARQFQMQIPGCVKDTHAILLIRQLNNTVKCDLVYLKNGSIRSPEAKNIDATMMFCGGYGEGFDLFLFEVDKNGNPLPDKLIANGYLIPFPLRAQDAQGHTVEVQAKDGTGQLFMITYSGFAPNEQIQFESRSSDELMSDTLVADENGLGFMIYAPAVVGRKEGPFEIKLKTKNMSQPLTLKHYWGMIAFRTLNKYHELQQKYP